MILFQYIYVTSKCDFKKTTLPVTLHVLISFSMAELVIHVFLPVCLVCAVHHVELHTCVTIILV